MCRQAMRRVGAETEKRKSYDARNLCKAGANRHARLALQAEPQAALKCAEAAEACCIFCPIGALLAKILAIFLFLNKPWRYAALRGYA